MTLQAETNQLLIALPEPANRRIALHVNREAERAIRNGHPWLFENSIERQSHEGKPGDLAVVFDQKRRFLAIGLYDPTSPLRLRVLQQGTQATIDQPWFLAQVTKAAQRRAPLLTGRTTGYRLVHGENDGLPGLVVDRYDQTLVIKLYTAGWVPHLPDLLAGLATVQPTERIVLRMSRALQKAPEYLYGLTDGMILTGPPLHGPVVFLENGLRFEADPIHGQKTGFFLDQRDNRARVEGLAAGKRVLNVFAYNGGFSLYAARGGAPLVASLDISRPALQAAERNFALNQDVLTVAATTHQLLVGDAFSLLAEMASNRRTFDLVIIDPPAFAKQQSEVERALAAYAQLTRLGLGVLSPGGTIVLASCSSRVSTDAFVNATTSAAASQDRPLRAFAQTAHALDHPIGFPEGAYLKCLFATA
ncbi:MAG: class I SAM-dependent rRNA methyltransferase [Caldilinea sp. CFX5]|nr:class I SAM-dependent rRNA methyltransferase [Caldilinea sp. CFX5]